MKLQIEKVKTTPQKFIGRFKADGGLDFGTYTLMYLKKYIKENPNAPFELKPILPESKKQRNFFEGAIVPLITFYQEGMDYRNSNDQKKVRDWLKIEFLGDLVVVGGKTHRVAQSTSQKLNLGFLERVETWLIENYAPPMEALDPKKYKHWRDAIFPYGGADNYLEYLLELGIIQTYEKDKVKNERNF